MPKGIRGVKIKIICETCSKEFMVLPFEATYKKFCSRKCANDRNPVTKTCLNCQKKFRHSTKIFCSRKCYYFYRKPPKQTCPQCKQEFQPKSRNEKTYCSHKCRELASRNRVNKICINCKKDFWVIYSKKERAKYCSKKCRIQHQYFSQEENEIVELIAKILNEKPKKKHTFSWLKSSKNRNMFLDAYFSKSNIAIEYDGKQHREFIPHYHKTKEHFKQSQKRDKRKEKLCKENGIILIRITDEEPKTKDYLLNKLSQFTEIPLCSDN